MDVTGNEDKRGKRSLIRNAGILPLIVRVWYGTKGFSLNGRLLHGLSPFLPKEVHSDKLKLW